jgi:hypothetical protein
VSHCELIPFVSGKPQDGIEFCNAWGGSARIWDSLFKAHVPKKHKYDSWISDNGDDRRLWDLATRKDLPMFERAIHAFTFDLFYVRREHFSRLASDLMLFAEKYPVPGRVDHLPAWAKWLDENRSVEAIGLYGTSVSENPWRKYDAKTDEMVSISLSEGVEVYEWLEL